MGKQHRPVKTLGRGLFFLGLILSAASLFAQTAEERGDRAFADRARGFAEGGRASAEPIEAAILAYEEALKADPDNLGLRLKLMEALYFKGYYVLQVRRQQRVVFDRLVELATRGLDLVDEGTGQAADLPRLSLEERAEVLRKVPGAAAAHYWAATGWGLWGVTHNPLAAVSKGVASKVREHSRMITLIDETHRDASGWRFLGRLYTDAPKVPFITGWVDREEGLEMLRRALAISRRDPRNLLFLAEAILAHEPEKRPEALALLREIVERGAAPDEVVEQSESVVRARELLHELSESSPSD